jgi:hypothetical protein
MAPGRTLFSLVRFFRPLFRRLPSLMLPSACHAIGLAESLLKARLLTAGWPEFIVCDPIASVRRKHARRGPESFMPELSTPLSPPALRAAKVLFQK